MTDLDILLPFFGDFSYLKEAVHSVLEQVDRRWRLVIVDDAYPDPQVYKWFNELGHPSVEYHRNTTNLGANANYRRSLSLARADHFVMMGADDVMLPNYVAVIHEAIEKCPEADVIQPGVQVIDGAGRAVLPLADRVKRLSSPHFRGRSQQVLSGEHLAKSLLRSNWTYFPSLCWRREAVDSLGFRDGLNVTQDLALLMDVLVSGGFMLLLREPAFLYRRHQSSDSAIRALSGSRFVEEGHLFKTLRDETFARNWPRAARAARLHLASRLHAATKLPSCLAQGDWQTAWDLASHALSP